MPQVKETVVKRGGVTADYWYETIHHVAVGADSELRLSFSMASKGGGLRKYKCKSAQGIFLPLSK